jgi:hypothetical protein
MPHLDLILEVLRVDLTAPRILLAQVLDEIADRHGYPENRLPLFFTEKLPQLEDYEVDLLFSPQYTPAEHNRLEYIPLLGPSALTPAEVTRLKRDLNDEGLTVLLRTPDERIEVAVPVHEMFIERYVNLLKLDQPLPEGVYDEIARHVPEASRNEVNLLARESVWREPGRTRILIAFLRLGEARNTFSTLKLSFLANFVRTYRPSGLEDLPRQLESLIRSCEADMDTVEARGFHDEQLKALNAGNRLVEPNADDVRAHYREMIAMARQLQEDYRHLEAIAPELAVPVRS